LTKFFPKEEMFGLTNQIRRAVVSVTSNIAEGFSRNSAKEKTQFYSIAKGSITEVQNQLLISKDVGYINNMEFETTEEQVIRVSKLITGLLKYTRNLSAFLFAYILHTIPFILFFTFILYTNPFILNVASAATLQRPPTYNSGLVGYWTMDGTDTNWGTNTMTDRSGNGNTGTITNMSTTTSPTIGKIGQGLSFDGGNDSVNISNESNFDFERTNTFSVSAWVYRNTNSGPHTIVSKRLNGGNFPGWYFSARNGGNVLDVVFRDSLGNSFTTSSVSDHFLPRAWDHVVFVYNGNSSNTGVRIYINGVDDTSSGSGTVSVSILNDNNLIIGVDPPGASDYWPGKIDDVRIYNRALSATEIKQLYNAGAAKFNVSQTRTGGTLDSGLVGYWTFDGKDTNWGSNTTIDKSGSGNTGTMTNMSTSTSPTPGKIGQALNFDGVNDYVEIGDPSVLNFGTGNFSVSTWLYATNNTNFRDPILFSNVSVSAGWAIDHIPSSSRLDFQSINSNVRAISTNFTNNVWHHVVGVRNGSTISIYVDGVKGTDATASDDINGATSLSIGGRYSLWSGNVDDTRIYSRALSASEIKQLYNAGAAKFNVSQTRTGGTLDSGLVGYWTFDGKDVSWANNLAYDRSGQGNNGTITNMSTTTSPTQGKIGQGLKFDGVDDYINTTYTVNTSSNTSACAWVKYNSNTANPSYIYNTTSNVPFQLYINNDAGDQDYIVVYNNNGTAVSSVDSIRSNTWFHTCGLVTSGNVGSIYINGVLAGGPTSLGAPIGSGNIRISNNTNTMNGVMDDARVYNRILSPSEIKQLYSLGR
jgi:four helix bundle protein